MERNRIRYYRNSCFKVNGRLEMAQKKRKLEWRGRIACTKPQHVANNSLLKQRDIW